MRSRSSETTLGAKVRQYILDKIEKEGLKPGDLLPSESELEATLNISRTTVRSAIIELQHEGYVIKKQGKGTFVANTVYEEQLTKLMGFKEDNESRGKTVTSIVVSMDMILPPDDIMYQLQISHEAPVMKLVRIRCVDGEATQLTTSYLTPELSQKINCHPVDFTKDSLYETMEALGYQLDSGEEYLEISFANSIQAGLLQVPEGFALFTTRRVVFGKDETPLEYSISYTRGDRHRAKIFLKR